MLDLTTIILALAIASPLVAARLIFKGNDPRRTAVIGAAASMVLSLLASFLPQNPGNLLTVGTLRATPLVLFTGIILTILLSAAKVDVRREQCNALLLCLSGTLMVYSGDNLLIIFAGWVLSAVPFIIGPLFRLSSGSVPWHARPSIALGVSIGSLAVAVALVAMNGSPSSSLSDPASLSALQSAAGIAALVFTTIAALIRNSVFPFHRWAITGFEDENILPYSSVLTAQLGAVLLARVALPLFPVASAAAIPYVSDLALFSALITSFMALGTKRPRRILALVASSQSAFVISGLESRNVEGITGALLQWLVVSVATAGLVIVYRAVELRTGGHVTPFAGIAEKAPRLAVFFILIALSLVGLPGTLGFCAEDLLFHGALTAHPFLGVALPVATALNAIHLYRLFSTLFLGRRPTHVAPVADVLPRERWCLSALVAFLVITGLAPQLVVPSRSASASLLMDALSVQTGLRMK